jgi:hypothetical protein
MASRSTPNVALCTNRKRDRAMVHTDEARRPLAQSRTSAPIAPRLDFAAKIKLARFLL